VNGAKVLHPSNLKLVDHTWRFTMLMNLEKGVRIAQTKLLLSVPYVTLKSTTARVETNSTLGFDKSSKQSLNRTGSRVN
jgi:hypothetical protein